MWETQGVGETDFRDLESTYLTSTTVGDEFSPLPLIDKDTLFMSIK